MSRRNKIRKYEKLRKKKFRKAQLMPEIDVYDKNTTPPIGSVPANHVELSHNNTYGPLPLFYVDKIIVCRDCGKEELWEARQQKWRYEVAKGNIYSQAIRCRSCRKIENNRKAEARRVHLKGLEKKKRNI